MTEETKEQKANAVSGGQNERLVMPSREDVYKFISEYYIHSRFEGRGQEYADLINDGYMEDLKNDGVGSISQFENKLGKFMQFDRALEIIDESAPVESATNHGTLSHILGV